MYYVAYSKGNAKTSGKDWGRGNEGIKELKASGVVLNVNKGNGQDYGKGWHQRRCRLSHVIRPRVHRSLPIFMYLTKNAEYERAKSNWD